MSTRFDAEYEPLCADRQLGEIALLPWDTEIFGFGVADWRRAPAGVHASDVAPALSEWAARRGVRLISASCDPSDRAATLLIQQCGFQFVDLSLLCHHHAIRNASLSPFAATRLDPATAGDLDAVAQLAESAFRFGRYTTDPRFPQELAARRWRAWVKNAGASMGEQMRLLVLRGERGIDGFFHLELKGAVADLRLGAVDAATASPIAGVRLYHGAILYARERGATRALAKISAANTAVLNLWAAAGFLVSTPAAVYHWHATV